MTNESKEMLLAYIVGITVGIAITYRVQKPMGRWIWGCRGTVLMAALFIVMQAAFYLVTKYPMHGHPTPLLGFFYWFLTLFVGGSIFRALRTDPPN